MSKLLRSLLWQSVRLFADMTKPLQSHAACTIINCRYDQAIVITRSPYDALIAEFHRQNQKLQYYESGHTEWANETLFYTKGRFSIVNQVFTR